MKKTFRQQLSAFPGLLWLVALLVGTIFAAYFPAIHGNFIWDDNAHVTKPELRSVRGLWLIWSDLGATQQYYPLLHSAFWVQHRLWGDATVGYHLVNILFHASAACLLLLILHRLKIPGAYLAAAIFGLHPVHVESVAWITEQKNTLSAVFYLGAMLAYLRFDEKRQALFYALALTLFVLALLSKTVTATLPAALLVLFWWKRGRLLWQRDVLPLIPWLVLGMIAGLFTAWAERKLIGAEGAAFDLTFLQRCLLAGRAIWFYLGKLFWPANLAFIYPRWNVSPEVWQYLFPAGVVAVSTALWLIRSRWRGPLAGLLFFIGSLFPVLGFFNVYPFVYSFVADHFQYLASLGIIVVASAGIAMVLARVAPRARSAGHALCMVLLATLTVLTWQQSRTYSDIQTLYRTTLERNPDCWLCHNNLGVVLDDAGRPQAATEHYKQALQINPNYAQAHNNLGSALARLGQVPEAIEHLELALRINPDYAEAYYNMGNVLLNLGRMQEAIGHYKQALRINPNDTDVYNNLGIALALTGRLSEAKEQYQAALRIRPDDALARHNLSRLQARRAEH